MLVAVLATLLDRSIVDFRVLVAGLVVGSAIGAVLAVRVQMTGMPQLVALFNGFGGGASVLVAGASFLEVVDGGRVDDQLAVAAALTALIGIVTLTGSLVAFAKLQEVLSLRGFRGLGLFRAALGLVSVGAAVMRSGNIFGSRSAASRTAWKPITVAIDDRTSTAWARVLLGTRSSEIMEAPVGAKPAATSGRRSPLLVTAAMVAGMRPGSLLVDLAVQRGGNCDLSVADQEVDHGGVTVLAPTDLASGSAVTASRMFATNVVNLIHMLNRDGEPFVDPDDDVLVGMHVTAGGEVVHPMVRAALDEQRAGS